MFSLDKLKVYDAGDPVFALGSLNLSHDDAITATEVFAACAATELKFSRLRRHPSTRSAVLAFLAHEAISKATAKVFTAHYRLYGLTAGEIKLVEETPGGLIPHDERNAPNTVH